MRHLLDLSQLAAKDVESLLEAARAFKRDSKSKQPRYATLLQGKRVALHMPECATHTIAAANSAVHQLGAVPLMLPALAGDASPALTVAALSCVVDSCILQAAPYLSQATVREKASIPLCNTALLQVLCDLFTIREQNRQLESWAAMRLAFVGDRNSSLAQALAEAAGLMGFALVWVGPAAEDSKHESAGDLQLGVANADVVYWGGFLQEKDAQQFEVTLEALGAAKPSVLYLSHTLRGPDSPRNVCLAQAGNYVHSTRAALLFLERGLAQVLGGADPSSSMALVAGADAPASAGVGAGQRTLRIVVALGGNALLQQGQKGTAEVQLANVRTACESLCTLLEQGHQLVIAHGNGPQVGAALLQQAAGTSLGVPAMPMDVCGSETQGFIGYMIQQTMRNVLRERNMRHKSRVEVVSVVTQVEVDSADPAFLNPTKPVGKFYTAEEAQQLGQEAKAAGKDFIFKEDAGRGWRRVVASPRPKRIVEINAVKALVDAGFVVVACGGGGVPVVRKEEKVCGIEAVIDKDFASALLAKELDADMLMILTDVPNVYINFRDPAKKEALRQVSVQQARSYSGEGHFAAGSMGPKILAGIQFVGDAASSRRAVITSLDKAAAAIQGQAGTHIVAS